MKDFIVKHKWTIMFVLLIISEFIIGIQNEAGIPPTWQWVIRSLGILITVLMTRVENVNIEIEKQNLKNEENFKMNRGGFLEDIKKITLFNMLIEMFTGFFMYIGKKETYRGNNRSHLLLGAGLLFAMCLLPLPSLQDGGGIILSVLFFSALALGTLIEEVQFRWFEGTRDIGDIVITSYGYLFALPIGLLFISLSTPWWILLGLVISSWITAFKIHSDF